MKMDPTKQRGIRIMESRMKFLLAFSSVTVEGVKNSSPEADSKMSNYDCEKNPFYDLLKGMVKFGNLLPKSIKAGLTVSLAKTKSLKFSIPLAHRRAAMKAMRFIRLHRKSSELSDVMSGETADVGSRRIEETEGMIMTKSRERKNPSPSILLRHLPEGRRTPPPAESSSPPKFVQSNTAKPKGSR